MKIKTYVNEDLSLFPLHLKTIGVNFKETITKRICGFTNNQIFMVNSGKGILKIDGQIFTLEKNDLFYIAANIPHEYYSIDNNFKTTFISFSGSDFEKTKKYYNLTDFSIYKNKNSGLFKVAAENLYANMNTIHEFSTLCSLTFSAVIAFFDEACKHEYSHIEKVYHYLEENYSKLLTLEDILTIYPYSKTKLCRDFKENYKMTIFEMLGKIRLRHAKNMIYTNPDISLKNVSLACGFNDTSYFCKMYKRFYNCSPKSDGNVI